MNLAAIEKANGPPKTDTARWQQCFDAGRGCGWRAYGERWESHISGCPNTKAQLLNTAGGKPRRSAGTKGAKRSRKQQMQSEGIGGMLVEVGQAAMQDPRLTDVDRDVEKAMFNVAYELDQREIRMTLRELERLTGHKRYLCQTALGRLERFGYLTRITRDEVERATLRHWLAEHTFKDGPIGGLYRMSLNPPRWDNVPDFAEPVREALGDDSWRDRVDALLGA